MAFNTPGVYVNQDSFGSVPAVINNHDAVYVLGTSENEDAPTNTPVFISSEDDFVNVFGVSPSAAAIKLFFDQRSGYGLYFINVTGRNSRTITVAPDLPAGTVASVTVDGFTVSYTTVEDNETPTVIREQLGNKINTQIPHIASYYTGVIRYKQGLVVSANDSVTLGTEVLSTEIRPEDIADSLKLAVEPGMRQGYICAPEFFQAYWDLVDRTTLQSLLESVAADPNYYFVAVIDCGETTATQVTGGAAINLSIQERNGFISPKGHSWYYFPYLVNLTDTTVPPSLAAIGVALRRTRAESFAQPNAGVNYPIYGVKDVSYPVTSVAQSQLNPLGINCIRRLPQGRGIVVYGARTLSTSNFYKFGSTRLVLNVLATSLRDAYDQFIFTLVDGQGILFSRIKQTASAICELLRLNGALFGATSADAYRVIADLTNNNLDDLDAGVVSVDVIVKPSPVLEVLKVTLSRASLGAVLAEIQASGSASPINTPPASPNLPNQ